MNIFEYLQEEGRYLEKKLTEVLNSLKQASREEVFDEIKLSCDNITGYVAKQQKLLLDPLADFKTSLQSQFDAHSNSMNNLKTELDNLVMVHVDEPGYDKYIENLIERVRECNASLKEFSQALVGKVPQDRINKLNEAAEEISHSSVQFNSLPVEKSMEEKEGVKQA